MARWIPDVPERPGEVRAMTRTAGKIQDDALPHLVVERSRAPLGNRRKVGRPVVIGAALVLLAAAGAVAVLSRGTLFGPTVIAPASPAPVALTPATVFGLGRLLPDGEVATIAAPFGAGDARIAFLHVREGQRVASGTLLATLDNEGALAAAVETARAAVASREAVLTQVRLSVQASREEASAALARAEATARNAERGFDRTESLRARDNATDATLDQRRATRDEAFREVERLRASLSRYLTAEPDGQADVVVARRALDAARADVARALADLDKARVRAPRDGTVLTIHARPGERPATQGILTFGDVDTMMVEIEVHQTQIGRIAVGDRVAVTAEALPRPLGGTVMRVGMEVVRQALVDPSPAANTDARVVRVTARLDAQETAATRGLTNLQVRARIMVRGGG